MAAAWGVVVPVKLLAQAKTRLSAYGDAARTALALAFAEDVVAAALACPAVAQVVVVSDDELAARLAGAGAQVVPDRPAAGLNAALDHGTAVLRATCPALGVAALSSDLPALRAGDLGAALRAAAALGGRAVVADADGSGTTLLAAPAGVDLAPAFGPGSRERHVAQGAAEVAGAPGLRRDVDTPDELRAAVRLGVGARTAAVLAALPVPR